MAEQKHEQFVNGGWETEPADNIQKQTTVVDLINCRILSSTEGGSYIIELIDGSKFSIQLPKEFKPIGSASVGRKDLILYCCNNQDDERGYIVYCNYDEQSGTASTIPLYCSFELAFSSEKMIRSIAIKETDINIKAYFWDDKNSPRSMVVSDFLRYITEEHGTTTAFVSGKKYMVLSGVVAQGATDYGIDEIENIFTANLTETLTPGAIIIPYVSIEILNITGKVTNVAPRLDRIIAGSLKAGSRYFFSQCCDQYGNGGPYSINSQPIFVTFGDIISNPVAVNYQLYQGADNEKDSNKGIRLTVENIDRRYTHIKMIAVRVTNELQFEVPIVFAFEPITADTMTFDHVLDQGIDSFDISELIGNILVILRNKDAAVAYNQLIIGNYETRAAVDYDLSSGITITTVDRVCPLDTVPQDNGGLNKDYTTVGGTTGKDLTLSYMTPDGGTPPLYRLFAGLDYVVEGGDIDIINSGGGSRTIIGTPGPTYWTVLTDEVYYLVNAGSPVVHPVIKIQKYTGNFFYHKINNDWLNYKGTAYSHYYKGLMDDETYRWGFMLVGLEGVPDYVHFLVDYKIPALSSNITTLNNSEKLVSGTIKGIKISGIDFNVIVDALNKHYGVNDITIGDLSKYYSGCSIVRAKRDKTILAQGLLWPMVGYFNKVYQIGAPTMQFDHWDDAHATGRWSGSFAFFSPEILLRNNELEYEDGDRLVIDDYLDLYKPGVASQGDCHTLYTNWYQKYFRTVPYNPLDPALGSSLEIEKKWCANLNVGEYLTVGALAWTSTFIGVTTTPAGGWTPTPDYVTFGGFRSSAPHYGFVNPYTILSVKNELTTFADGFGMRDSVKPSFKPLVSVRRPKNVLYGGSSKAAKAATEYYSCGHFQKFDQDFISYLQIVSSGIMNDVEVFGGDTFINAFDYVRMYGPNDGEGITLDDAAFSYPSSQSLIFPVKSTINCDLRQGRHIAKDLSFDVNISGVRNPDGICSAGAASPDRREQFVYNAAFSTDLMWEFPFIAFPNNYQDPRKYEKTFAISLQKTDGEIIDSWRRFSVNRTLNVENDKGPINAIRSKLNRLFYWQEDSVGYVPIRERVSLANATGQIITLAENNTIDRYDTLNSDVGCQHTFGIVETEDGFMFWDAKRKGFFLLKGGQTVNLSLVKQNFAHFKNNFFGEYVNNEAPMLGSGMSSAYNKRFGEAMFLFKNRLDKNGNTLPDVIITYDTINNQFNGKFIFELSPGILLTHLDNPLMSIPFLDIATPGESFSKGTFYEYGDFVYYALEDIVIPDPIDLNDPVFYAVGLRGSVHVLNLGEPGMVFNINNNAEVELVINPAINETLLFSNIKLNQAGSTEKWTKVQHSNSSQFVEEVIKGRNYKFVNKLFEFSIAKDPHKSLFTDTFHRLRLIKVNRDAQFPDAGTALKVKLMSVLTYFKKYF
jgi:hypothetical protein